MRRTETSVKRNRDNPDEKPPLTPRRRDAESKAGDTDLRRTPHPGVKSQPFSSGEESENAGVEIRSDEPKPENKKVDLSHSQTISNISQSVFNYNLLVH